MEKQIAVSGPLRITTQLHRVQAKRFDAGSGVLWGADGSRTFLCDGGGVDFLPPESLSAIPRNAIRLDRGSFAWRARRSSDTSLIHIRGVASGGEHHLCVEAFSSNDVAQIDPDNYFYISDLSNCWLLDSSGKKTHVGEHSEEQMNLYLAHYSEEVILLYGSVNIEMFVREASGAWRFVHVWSALSVPVLARADVSIQTQPIVAITEGTMKIAIMAVATSDEEYGGIYRVDLEYDLRALVLKSVACRPYPDWNIWNSKTSWLDIARFPCLIQVTGDNCVSLTPADLSPPTTITLPQGYRIKQVNWKSFLASSSKSMRTYYSSDAIWFLSSQLDFAISCRVV